jgi:membrane protein implicated in regulation of membrane protease activity
LVVVAAVLAGQGTLRWSGAVTIGVAAALAGVVMPLGLAGIPVAPLLLMSALLVLAFENRRRDSATTPCDVRRAAHG